MVEVRDFRGILTKQSWAGTGTTGRSAFVTYSFESVAQGYLSGVFAPEFISSFQPLSAAEKALARTAINAWANASGLVLLEVTAGLGDIRFGAFDMSKDPATSGSAGVAFFPLRSANATTVSEGDDTDGDIFLTRNGINSGLLLHEIGHALGFKHPFEGDPVLAADLDNKNNTVMSYSGLFNPTALGPFDVQAVRHVYGTKDGAHLSSFSWNAITKVLTQNGKPGADRILGVSVTDIINGLDGNDLLAGFGGFDILTGGNGTDRLFGGDANDKLHGGSGNDFLFGQAANDLIFGDAHNDTITGGFGNDQLNGGIGNDKVDGQEGNDLVNGGAGLDTLTGGNGTDIFRFDTPLIGSTNVDVLADYTATDDTIQIQNAVFTSLVTDRSAGAHLFREGFCRPRPQRLCHLRCSVRPVALRSRTAAASSRRCRSRSSPSQWPSR